MSAVTSTFSVPGLHCAGCIAKLEGGLARTDGVISARVNFTKRRVAIAHTDKLGDDHLREIIGRIGFPAERLLGEEETRSAPESRELGIALGVAGFAAMNIMLLSVSVWSGAQGATRDLFHWLSALIALPTVAYAGRPFFRSAWGALRHGRTNMDVPISIGVTMACAASLYETINSGPHAYFDGAVMLLFFLLAGRFLDSVMRVRAEDGVAALQRQRAPRGLVVGKDGVAEWRNAEEIAPGMTLLVAAGETFAADGVIVSGASSIDRQLVTGESAPENVGIGDAVLAGTINLAAPLTVKVSAAGEGTAIAGIARLMEAASGAKSRYVRLADRAARYYAPAVHVLAALSLVGWLIAGAGLHQAVLIAVAVLIITCPCALGLAVPVAQVVAAGSLMRRGVLIRDGAGLERLAEANVALFDKTGTLTLGRPRLIDDGNLSPDERPVALALAQRSRHPLARALATALEGIEAADISDVEEAPGLGVAAIWKGQRAFLGRIDDAGPEGGEAPGHHALTTGFRLGGGPARLLRFEDALRPDADAAIARLDALHMQPTIVSGDRERRVARLAVKLGMRGQGDLDPQGKLEVIARLSAQGHRVLMVGDGLNDGPALNAAHVSMAPSSASDVGQSAADLVFLGDSLSAVPASVAAARRTMRVVKQNFAMAIGYNVLAVPLAVAGMVTPLVAALAMSLSSIIVVGNSLRLRDAAR
ncbi:heavy metal translocating P-type ATPase (plasmid) [Sphingobium sp. WTD-1]|uniref:Cadmium-translocating P-type ATPase n=1 Tax=Sphingobium yanoikuyae TaxID=13690 RepID=A0A9X7UFG5_SPHYA|nr:MULTISPECIES: heavy metal translocating P-type ATPase [Sphingobium]MDG2515137.1 heavy metal translocating P-type ATPase [Sphingobium yanoikuyae]QNG49371.1 cadmium-translocating P-type ATPase [Sphingobium yanoikuyae]WIA59112.1 heavy metal translocating P-type ATPase [Sphingobium sp. WTD-1]